MARTGRPSAYKSEYADQAYKYCLLGAKDEEMANFFGVSVATFSNWKNAHPEFLDALKNGKAIADANVSHSLYRRAIGYDYNDTALHVVDKAVVATPVVKHQPPDVVACIFWLKNRQIGRWRDKVEQDVKVVQRTLAEELAELNGKPDPADH